MCNVLAAAATAAAAEVARTTISYLYAFHQSKMTVRMVSFSNVQPTLHVRRATNTQMIFGKRKKEIKRKNIFECASMRQQYKVLYSVASNERVRQI